jgi:hypothetical protein
MTEDLHSPWRGLPSLALHGFVLNRGGELVVCGGADGAAIASPSVTGHR